LIVNNPAKAEWADDGSSRLMARAKARTERGWELQPFDEQTLQRVG
jgi:hypothetical protein